VVCGGLRCGVLVSSVMRVAWMRLAKGTVALSECGRGWTVSSPDQMAWASSVKAAGSRCLGSTSTLSS
jgi:hypothetical protein